MKTSVFTAAIAAAGVLFFIASAQAQTESLREQIQGTTWHLVSLTVTPPNGSPVHPSGPNPTGYTILDRTGHFITVTWNPAVPKFASNDVSKATDAELRAAWLGGIVDFGTYEVDEESRALIMHVEGASFPNWSGTDLHNATELKGNRMTWTNSSGPASVVLVWERVR